ncbi:MAG: copper transporter [Sporichthyaceae bacterium]|nr:copper transporter [Sporichthyaceae bacterium]
MIDFRYHVVSLVAVLLALATGILVGSSVLQGPLLQQLTRTTDQLRSHTDDLQRQIQALERRKAFAEAAADQFAPDLVGGQLAGESVALVTLPGSNQDITEATVAMLEQAGARVASRVQIGAKYADSEQEGVLDDLVNQLAPAGTEWPDDSSVYDRAGLELATALVTTDFVPAGQPFDDDATQILSGLEAGDFISMTDDDSAGPATMAVVMAAPASEPAEAGQRATNAYLALAKALDERSRGAVVAGSEEAAAEGGLVAAVRANSDVANVVSTIDVANTPIGRIGVVYALEEQTRGGSGQYGISGTTDGPLPDLTKEGSP